MAALLQVTANGDVPELIVAIATPLLPPKQVTFVVAMFIVVLVIPVTVADAVAEHPFASVAVTVYVPAKTFVAVAVF